MSGWLVKIRTICTLTLTYYTFDLTTVTMKLKLAFVNFALILYLVGLLCSIGIGMSSGAIVILFASAIITGVYLVQLYNAGKEKKIFSSSVLLYTLGVLVLAEIFIQGFSISIGMSLFALPGFYHLHVFIGFILLALFAWFNYTSIRKIDQKSIRSLLLVGLGVFCFLSLIGFLSFAGIVPGAVKLIYYGFVFLTFFYLLYFLLSLFLTRQLNQSENRIGLLLSSLLVLFWILRWQTPDLISPGFYRVILHLGFVMIVILPFSIVFINKIHFLTVFILYTTLLDLYFIAYDREFKYLVNVGGNECVGYDNATDYPVVNDPGISIEELFKIPTADELKDIINEWESKAFTPMQVQTEYAEQKPNGDSIKVISHYVSGQKHYGIIRIPAGIDTKKAPILLALQGGGAEIDVLESTSLFKISGGMCRDVLSNYITIAASFRGDIVKGDGFCFRSEGYTGDVWLGAAEDAVSFLEVVKAMYSKADSAKVLAMGVSRGATVALIIGALTEKLDHIISISTHANFLNMDTFRNERVGSDYRQVFFTPQTTPENIRKRLLASSPYYFAERLPVVEIHQGTEDILTTVHHAKQLAQRLHEVGRNDSTFRIYYYEGKGHGYDDDNIVCKSLFDFANK